jgi:hypothetical protein
VSYRAAIEAERKLRGYGINIRYNVSSHTFIVDAHDAGKLVRAFELAQFQSERENETHVGDPQFGSMGQ